MYCKFAHNFRQMSENRQFQQVFEMTFKPNPQLDAQASTVDAESEGVGLCVLSLKENP
ncbi:MAG: hypothetical protein RJB45_1908 [Pseudomonadota bacterium]|jgi:hypothetical protein